MFLGVMNMKQIVVTLFLLLSVFVLWRYTYIFPCMPSHFYCVSDSLFSVKSVSFFNEQLMRCAQKKKSLNDTIGEVKTACPFIKDISIAYRPHGGVVQFFS